MSQQELLKRVIGILDGLGVAYMVTGSVTSSLQGEPRSTHDIDLVVDLAESDATRIFGAFPPDDFYVSEQAIREALARRTTFNLIDLNGGDRVDFWLLTDEPFDRSRFARRRIIEALGLRFAVSTPEDTILMKLRWAERSGGSEKQFTDALRVYEVQHGHLDLDYLNEWAGKLGIETIWQRLCDEAAPI
ncbi:MAG: hypothetical protein ACYC61_03930 [Isosphaeraceae bacterium]